MGMEGRRRVVGDTECLVPVVMIVLGVLLLAVVFYDALCTTLVTTAAGGPLTARISAGGWWLTAERHLTYPVLHYFHSPQRHKDFRFQLCNVDEAVTLLQHGIPEPLRPHPAALRSIRHASNLVIQVVRTDHSRPEQPPVLDLTPLAKAGIPTVDAATFTRRLDDLAEHRCSLAVFAQHSPWHGEDG